MSIFERLAAKPRSFAARGWIFQIHLYAGLIAALYALVIGLTGSVLVFGPEMRDWQDRDLMRVSGTGTQLAPEKILESVRAAHPGASMSLLYMPTESQPVFRVSASAKGKRFQVYLNPLTAQIVGEQGPRKDLLSWLEQLHFNLLLGTSAGRIANGIGALVLLLLCVSGIVVWWPGKSLWVRAVSINFQRRWKRVNYDIHSAVGFFSLLFVVLLSLTGAYFSWPKQSRQLISLFSTVRNTGAAPVLPASASAEELPISQLLQVAARNVPDAWLELVIFPSGPKQPLRVYLMSGGPRDYQTTSTVDIDQRTGEVLRVDRAQGRSAGDALVAWVSVLHFGAFGGVPVKILWVVLGLTPLILGVSGALMWWNRVAGKKYAKWRGRDARTVKAVEEPVREEACL